MNATELFNLVSEALAVAGRPEWESFDKPCERESLVFLKAEAVEEGPAWAIVLGGPDAPEGDDDYLPVAGSLAERLIRLHLQGWLLERGWQVQVTWSRGCEAWRLADCLSFGDGGGDRLDDDYPRGPNELAVLCAAVQAVSRHSYRPKARGPA